MIAYLQNKGMSPVISTLILAAATIITAALTSLGTTNVSVAEVRGEINVVSQREDDHYKEVQNSLKRIEDGVNELRKQK